MPKAVALQSIACPWLAYNSIAAFESVWLLALESLELAFPTQQKENCRGTRIRLFANPTPHISASGLNLEVRSNMI